MAEGGEGNALEQVLNGTDSTKNGLLVCLWDSIASENRSSEWLFALNGHSCDQGGIEIQQGAVETQMGINDRP